MPIGTVYTIRLSVFSKNYFLQKNNNCRNSEPILAKYIFKFVNIYYFIQLVYSSKSLFSGQAFYNKLFLSFYFN